MKGTKNIVILILYVAFLIFGGVTQVSAAPFQNGDFETGDFTGWSGQLDDGTNPVVTVDPDTDSHFTLFHSPVPSYIWVAQVQNDNTYWIVTLFQDFTLDTLLPGWTMDITFWIQWEPTDSTSDSLSATLSDTGGTDTVDLLSGVSTSALTSGTWVTQDITTFAQNWGGQDVELAFTIMDFDGNAYDTFSIDNISFNKHPAPVPEPATILLLGSGLCGLAAIRRKKRN